MFSTSHALATPRFGNDDGFKSRHFPNSRRRALDRVLLREDTAVMRAAQLGSADIAHEDDEVDSRSERGHQRRD